MGEEIAKGVYTVIEVTVKNNDKESRTIDSSLFKLIDNEGREYNPDTSATLELQQDSDFFLTSLNPGLKLKGCIAFDVPTVKKGYFLSVTDEIFSSQEKQIKLSYKDGEANLNIDNKTNKVSLDKDKVYRQTGILPAFHDGYIYYRGYHANIFRMKEDGSQKERLNEDSSISLQIVDNWIYYINDSDKSRLYRLKLDGTQNQKLSDITIHELVVTNKYIYFTNADKHNSICRTRLDGSEYTNLINTYNSSSLNIVGENIYYCVSGATIARMRIDGSERLIICNDDVYFLKVNQGWIYYDCFEGFFKIKVDGSCKTLIKEDGVGDFDVYGDRLYYTNYCGFGLYESTINGTNEREIANNYKIYSIGVLNNWIYCPQHYGEGIRVSKDGLKIEEIEISDSEETMKTRIDESVIYHWSRKNDDSSIKQNIDLDNKGELDVLTITKDNNLGEIHVAIIINEDDKYSYEFYDLQDIFLVDLNSDGKVEIITYYACRISQQFKIYYLIDGKYVSTDYVFDFVERIEDNKIIGTNNIYIFEDGFIKDKYNNIM